MAYNVLINTEVKVCIRPTLERKLFKFIKIILRPICDYNTTRCLWTKPLNRAKQWQNGVAVETIFGVLIHQIAVLYRTCSERFQRHIMHSDIIRVRNWTRPTIC